MGDAYHQETEYQSCSSLSKLRVNPILQLESAALTGALERIHPKGKTAAALGDEGQCQLRHTISDAE